MTVPLLEDLEDGEFDFQISTEMLNTSRFSVNKPSNKFTTSAHSFSTCSFAGVY